MKKVKIIHGRWNLPVKSATEVFGCWTSFFLVLWCEIFRAKSEKEEQQQAFRFERSSTRSIEGAGKGQTTGERHRE